MDNHDERGFVRPDEEEEINTPIEQGINYLLVIGINAYEHCGQLQNARGDAEDFAALLLQHYQFEPANITYLLDEEATRDNIHQALRELAEVIEADDNLVVYFSGHGYYDRLYKEAYWVPVDARYQQYVDYFSYSALKTAIHAIPSQHTFLIVDSCYSGAIFVESRNLEQANRFERDPSRWMLASGRNEVVPDGVYGEHSPFSDQLLNTLYRYASEGLRISSLIEKVITATIHNSAQTPIGRPMYDVGDQGGEFFFHPKHSGAVHKKKVKGDTYQRPSRIRPKLWQKHPRKLQLALYLLFFIPLGIWALQPKQQLMADIILSLDRFSFENHHKAGLFYDREVPMVSLLDLETVEIIADSLQMNIWGDSVLDERRSLKKSLFMEAERGISATLNLSSVIFDRFYLPPAHLISLEQPEQEPGQLRIWFQAREQAPLELQFNRQLNFSAEYVNMKTGEEHWEKMMSPRGQLYMNGSQNGLLKVKSHPESNRIFLQFSDSLRITAKALKIGLSCNSFIKRDEEKPISTIRGGKMLLLDHRANVADSIFLSKGEFLCITPSHFLTLSQIDIHPQGMELHLKGEIDMIRVGPDKILRNPSRLWWYWHSRKLELAFVGLGLLGLLYLLTGQTITTFWNLVAKLFGS